MERMGRLTGSQSIRRVGESLKSNSAHPHSVKSMKKSKLSPEKSTFDLQREFFLHLSFTVSRSSHWFSALLVHHDQQEAQESSQTKELPFSTLRFLM